MEIVFANKKLKELCESSRKLQRAHGQACARKARARLADLEAAPQLHEMRALPGKCHELDGDRAGQLAVDVGDGKRVVFEPVDDPPPVKPDGGLDWQSVKAIRVLEIANYHKG